MMRSRYPEMFGIRKVLQRIKVKRLYRYLLSEQEIRFCEENPLKKKEIIIPYLSRWEKYLKSTVLEMEDIFENAPMYKNRLDKESIATDMIFCRLAYGFIPSEYVCFEFENKTPSERKEYISDIDMNVFGYSVNNIKVLQNILDKGDSYRMFCDCFKRDVLVIENATDYASFHKFIKKHPVFVKKKVFSSMGHGIELVDIKGIQIPEKEYFKGLICSGKYLLEECVSQSPEMAKYNQSSVNTVRCITFRTNRGIEVPWCFMRTGRDGAFVDNGGSGGLVIGIDAETGVVNTNGYDEYNNLYQRHPDTGVAFMGSKIPEWDKLINLCTEAAGKVDGIGYLSWDLAFAKEGWDVIEVNEVGQFIGPQMTMKRGIKSELWEYLSRMAKVV